MEKIYIPYLRHIRGETIRIVLYILAPAALLAMIIQIFYAIPLKPILIATGVFTAILALRYGIIKYRMKKGWFGNTEDEARDLIAFADRQKTG